MELTKAFKNIPGTLFVAYKDRLRKMLAELDLEAVHKIGEVLAVAANQEKQIFLLGNGGNAATCSHFANDLSPNCLVTGEHKARVICLSDNVAQMSAIANDSGFEFVFSAQLRSKMRPGDVVLGMSVSGDSPNVCNALEWANQNDAETIGWAGMNGGRLMRLAKWALHIPCLPDEYGPAEDMFLILSHMISNYVTLERGGKLFH